VRTNAPGPTRSIPGEVSGIYAAVSRLFMGREVEGAMTRKPRDQEPDDTGEDPGHPGGRAADRLREFELQRGLEPEVPSESGDHETSDDPGPSDDDQARPATEEA
jgi:hypothetical protein